MYKQPHVLIQLVNHTIPSMLFVGTTIPVNVALTHRLGNEWSDVCTGLQQMDGSTEIMYVNVFTDVKVETLVESMVSLPLVL